MPKNKHPVWVNFECKIKKGNTGKWAVCKKCKKEMQGIPSRMMKHLKACADHTDSESESKSRNSNDEDVLLSNKQTGNYVLLTSFFTFL